MMKSRAYLKKGLIIKYLILLNLLCVSSISADSTKSNHIKSLTLTTSKTHFIRTKETEVHPYYPIVAPLKVVARYEDGYSEEVTDMVTWESNTAGMSVDKYGVKLVKGDFSITSSLDGITSNNVEIKVEDDDNVAKFLRVKIDNNNKEAYPNRGAYIQVALVHKPTSDVKVKLKLKESDGMRFKYGTALSKELIFEPLKYRHYVRENIYVMEHELRIVDDDINNTNSYTIEVEPLESQDPFYSGEDPVDIIVEKKAFSIVEPPLQQRRGAIRGVTIVFELLSKERGVEYILVDPPKGMKIIGYARTGMGATMFGKEVEWKVPMDIEEKTYNITAKATDVEGNTQMITFPIKVPKTKPIQTKFINNELIVTDKSSNLYGMKMKGHSGEDISKMRIRSVAYGDVWKKYVKNKQPEDVVEHIVFILDDMPSALDVKMPEWMDSIEKSIKLDIDMDRHQVNVDSDAWVYATDKGYEYEGTSGAILFHKLYISEIYLLTIKKAQLRGL